AADRSRWTTVTQGRTRAPGTRRRSHRSGGQRRSRRGGCEALLKGKGNVLLPYRLSFSLVPFSLSLMKIGANELTPPFALAPMAGMTDTAFRRLVKRKGGCGLVVSEMVSSEGL